MYLITSVTEEGLENRGLVGNRHVLVFIHLLNAGSLVSDLGGPDVAALTMLSRYRPYPVL